MDVREANIYSWDFFHYYFANVFADFVSLVLHL